MLVGKEMKAKTTEVSWGGKSGPDGTTGQSRKQKVQQMKDQPQERRKTPTTDWSIQGGTASNPGLDHPGGWA